MTTTNNSSDKANNTNDKNTNAKDVSFKAINVKSVRVDIQDELLSSRTFTRNRINTTCVNSISLILAANACNSIKRTVSCKKIARYIVTKMRVTSAYHSKDSVTIAKSLKEKNADEILSDKSLTEKCVRITSNRIRNHVRHHTFVTKKLCSLMSIIDDNITFSDDFIEVVKTDKSVRKHVSELTKQLKSASQQVLNEAFAVNAAKEAESKKESRKKKKK
jgi:hypothetical protein